MFDEKQYWADVQNFKTRPKDALVLIQKATEAIHATRNSHIRASACAVIIYRYLENKSVRNNVDLAFVDKIAEETSSRLRFRGDAISLRWFLSLNMAYANLQVLLGNNEKAINFLFSNVDQLHKSIVFGQPFTNVLKSFAAIVGILKFCKSDDVLSFDVFKSLCAVFVAKGVSASSNYSTENPFVFEELSLVNAILFSVAKCHYFMKANPAAGLFDALGEFDEKSIPLFFSRAIKEIGGVFS